MEWRRLAWYQYGLGGEGRHVVIGDFPEWNIVRQVCLLNFLGGRQLLSPLRLESFPPGLLVRGSRGGSEHGVDLGLGARHGEDQVGGLGGRGGDGGLERRLVSTLTVLDYGSSLRPVEFCLV